MEADFVKGMPKFTKQYVMFDWDETFSLNPETMTRVWNTLRKAGFICKVCTARNDTCDNQDIFDWIDICDVIFCNGMQKKDVLIEEGILRNEVAFWIDDSPEAIVDKEDIGNLMWYFNS